VAATGLLTATVQVGLVGLWVTGPGVLGVASGKPLPRPAYCITLGVGEVGSCGWGDLGEVAIMLELGDCRADDRRGELDTRGVFDRGKGILIGKAGGERELEFEVWGKGVDIERREAGRGLLRFGRTEKDWTVSLSMDLDFLGFLAFLGAGVCGSMCIGVVPCGPPDKEMPPAPAAPTSLPGMVGSSVVGRLGRDFLVGERGPEPSPLAELFLFLAFTFLGTPAMETKLSWLGTAKVGSCSCKLLDWGCLLKTETRKSLTWSMMHLSTMLWVTHSAFFFFLLSLSWSSAPPTMTRPVSTPNLSLISSTSSLPACVALSPITNSTGVFTSSKLSPT